MYVFGGETKQLLELAQTFYNRAQPDCLDIKQYLLNGGRNKTHGSFRHVFAKGTVMDSKQKRTWA